MAVPDTDLEELGTEELGLLVRRALDVLAARGDQAAFSELLALSGRVGTSIADAARGLAATGSWSQVADLSGTTKQAAWSRWRQ